MPKAGAPLPASTVTSHCTYVMGGGESPFPNSMCSEETQASVGRESVNGNLRYQMSWEAGVDSGAQTAVWGYAECGLRSQVLDLNPPLTSGVAFLSAPQSPGLEDGTPRVSLAGLLWGLSGHVCLKPLASSESCVSTEECSSGKAQCHSNLPNVKGNVSIWLTYWVLNQQLTKNRWKKGMRGQTFPDANYIAGRAIFYSIVSSFLLEFEDAFCEHTLPIPTARSKEHIA